MLALKIKYQVAPGSATLEKLLSGIAFSATSIACLSHHGNPENAGGLFQLLLPA